MQQPYVLPMTKSELQKLGWQELDILLVTGDAYVDHPSFGVALLGRYLVNLGYRTGIIAQPDWKNPLSIQAMGRPLLFAGVTAGAMDSMVSNYTANKKLRRDDDYSPGGQYGMRPNRASVVYTNLVKAAFPGLPIVLGGIEASMRRLAQYDYWDETLRRSLLLDAKADILVYGMGELQVKTIAKYIVEKKPLVGIPGTAIACSQLPEELDVVTLPGFESLQKDKSLLIQATLLNEAEQLPHTGKPLAQLHGTRYVLVYPPARPLTTPELDALYALPFIRQPHPVYREAIPGLATVINSITTHRGCFGGCTFCALGSHQGKLIQSRSEASILTEIKRLTQLKSFHGTITDLGGPSANMYSLHCKKPDGPCKRPSCLYPSVCSHLATDHAKQMHLLHAASQVPGVKHVFVASGIRYDLALEDPRYIRHLVQGQHICGTLKIAPEHTNSKILNLMRKPAIETCDRFLRIYTEAAESQGERAYTAAYFIASFPGSTSENMRELQDFVNKHRLHADQMQDFIPLPMTLAGVMYYTEKNPWTQEPLYIPKTAAERHTQRRVLLGRNFVDKAQHQQPSREFREKSSTPSNQKSNHPHSAPRAPRRSH